VFQFVIPCLTFWWCLEDVELVITARACSGIPYTEPISPTGEGIAGQARNDNQGAAKNPKISFCPAFFKKRVGVWGQSPQGLSPKTLGAKPPRS